MAVNNGMIAGVSLISFEQLCVENDPNFYRGRDHPWIYRFTNGRCFNRSQDMYDAVLVPVAPQFNALSFHGKALHFGDEQLQFGMNYTGENAVDALAPFPDETEIVFTDALGFNNEPLNFGTQQIEYRRNYTGENAVDPFASLIDSTKTVFASSIGFGDRPLNFETQQLEFLRPKFPEE